MLSRLKIRRDSSSLLPRYSEAFWYKMQSLRRNLERAMRHAQVTVSYGTYTRSSHREPKCMRHTRTKLAELDSNSSIIPDPELIVIRATETCFNKPPLSKTDGHVY